MQRFTIMTDDDPEPCRFLQVPRSKWSNVTKGIGHGHQTNQWWTVGFCICSQKDKSWKKRNAFESIQHFYLFIYSFIITFFLIDLSKRVSKLPRRKNPWRRSLQKRSNQRRKSSKKSAAKQSRSSSKADKEDDEEKTVTVSFLELQN